MREAKKVENWSSVLKIKKSGNHCFKDCLHEVWQRMWSSVSEIKKSGNHYCKSFIQEVWHNSGAVWQTKIRSASITFLPKGEESSNHG